MKKLLIVLSLATVCSTANAQLQKGRMLLGGSFNTSGNKTTGLDTNQNVSTSNEQNYKTYTGTVRYGYFIANGFMVGILGNYNRNVNQSNYKNSIHNSNGITVTETSSKTINDGIGGGAFARYYKMIGESRFAWFGELSASYTQTKSKYTAQNNGIAVVNPFPENKTIGFGVLIRPGITYFFKKTLAIEASFGNLGYNYRKSTIGKEGTVGYQTNTNSGVNSNLNFSLSNVSLGINFYFGGK